MSRPRSPARMVRASALLVAAVLASAPAASPVIAQGVRGTVQLFGRTVEMRPLLQDTVSIDRVEVGDDGRLFFDGKPVYCTGGPTCDYWRSLATQTAAVLTADVSVTAWGLGIQGLSATGLFRVRADTDSDFVWPQSQNSFDAMLGYLQYVRGNLRVRGGRQRTMSGLGFSGFDGLDVMWEATDWVRLEGYAGRSLARGLYEPRHEALRGLENFHTDQDAYLFGAYTEFEPTPGSTISLRYQREIWRNRSALVSERASLDFRTTELRPVTLFGAMDWDFAFGQLGKAHLTGQVPWRGANLLFEATARRYRPYFELWTIWGYFSPVAYNEGEFRVTFSGIPNLRIYALGSYLKYENSNTSSLPWGDLDDDIARYGAGVSWTPSQEFFMEGEYLFQCCSGAYLSSGEARLRWQPHWRFGVTGYGTAFQQFQEFRIGEGIGVGGGLTLDVGLTRRSAFSGGISTYRLLYENQTANEDWDQLRGWIGLRVDFGEDPGMAAVRGRAR